MPEDRGGVMKPTYEELEAYIDSLHAKIEAIYGEQNALVQRLERAVAALEVDRDGLRDALADAPRVSAGSKSGGSVALSRVRVVSFEEEA